MALTADKAFMALAGWLGAWVLIFWSWITFFIPKKKKSIAGEIALVTGAGSGIGRLMSLNFSRQGATVVLWDINKEGVDETAKQIRQLGGKAHSYVCDVTKKEEVYRIAEQVTKDVGHVTILVNNAGVVAGKKFLQCSDESIERTMNVNVMAIFWTLKAFLPSMMTNNHGHIVTIASIAGSLPCPGLVEYCASKFAAVGLHDTLVVELAGQGLSGIHTTLVQPFWIDTGMFDGVDTGGIPLLEPQYVADKIVEAVQINQRTICLPRLMYFLAYFRSWMPVNAMILLAKTSGAVTAMDNYVGRQKKES
ncbi:epidermal retinol dehydrogenase 2-like [Glandiceps talaboti]